MGGIGDIDGFAHGDGVRHPGRASRTAHDRDYYDGDDVYGSGYDRGYGGWDWDAVVPPDRHHGSHHQGWNPFDRDVDVENDDGLPSSAYSNEEEGARPSEPTIEEKDLLWLLALVACCCFLPAFFACRRRRRNARRVGQSRLDEMESRKAEEEVGRTERLVRALNATSMTVQDRHLIADKAVHRQSLVENDVEMGFESNAGHEIASGCGEGDAAASTSGTKAGSDGSPGTGRNGLESTRTDTHDGENSYTCAAAKQDACNSSGYESAGCLANECAEQQETGNDDDGNKDLVLCLPCLAASLDDANAGAPALPRLVPATCAICLTEYSPGCHVAWSSNAECAHAFHRQCILMWLLKNEKPMCPCCRRAFVIADGVGGES